MWWLLACSYIDEAKQLSDVPAADCAEQSMWFADDDGDGAGDPRDAFVGCVPPTGYIAAAGDCADDDASTLECPSTDDTGTPPTDDTSPPPVDDTDTPPTDDSANEVTPESDPPDTGGEVAPPPPSAGWLDGMIRWVLERLYGP